MFRVYQTPEFLKRAEKSLSPQQYRNLHHLYARAEAGLLSGKTLGPVWLKELRLVGKRVYFFEYGSVMVFAQVGDKKEQQGIIDTFRNSKKDLLSYLESLNARE